MSMMKMLFKLFFALLILTLVNCGGRRRKTPTPKKPTTKPPGPNLALGGTASQSNTVHGGQASRAIDGSTDRNWGGNSCTHTDSSTNPSWTVDLKSSFIVDEVRISNRKDCCSDRLNNAQVFVVEGGVEQLCGSVGIMRNIEKKVVSCNGKKGSQVRVKITGSQKVLTLCEVEVYGRAESKACGRRGMNSKRVQAATNHMMNSNHVINGNLAAPGDWPWAASLQFKNQFVGGRHFCGATLIDTKWAVTAAQCLTMYEEQKKFGNFTLVAGISKLSNAKAQSQTFGFEKVIIHPDFASVNVDMKSDIALIKLNKDVRLSPKLSIACMPNEQVAPSPGESCYFLGWGSSQYPKPSTNDLQQAKVPIVASSKCTPDTETQPREAICAGYETSGASACQFDAGGPLLCERSGRWVIHGVVSFSMKHCDSYTGFTPVNKYRMWIEDTMRKN